MGVPSENELEQALSKAKEMREHDDDPHFLAKSFLNLNYRVKLLEKVMSQSKLYLHSGHGSREHSVLLKAIENAEKAAVVSTDDLAS